MATTYSFVDVSGKDSEFAETCNQVLEQFFGHISSLSLVKRDDGSLHLFAHAELPAYIHEDEKQSEYVINLVKKHLKITHGLQDEEITINSMPRKNQGDLDDYLNRNY